MRRGRGLVKRIYRHRLEDAKLDRHRLLKRRTAFGLRDLMRERRPWQRESGTRGLGRGALGFGAAHGRYAAFAARDALRRFMQVSDRALAADRPVISVRGSNAETIGKLPGGVLITPAQEIDDVERLNLAQQFSTRVLLGARERLFEQRERFQTFGNLLRAIRDFADADDDGNALVGDGGGYVSHGFLFSLSSQVIPSLASRVPDAGSSVFHDAS